MRGQHENWLRNGGGETLRSYGIRLSWPTFRRITSTGLTPSSTQHDDGRRLFVHAGINPVRPLDQQDDHDLRWIREPFLSDDRDYGRLVVHGHTPLHTNMPDQRPNRLESRYGCSLWRTTHSSRFHGRSDSFTSVPAGVLSSRTRKIRAGAGLHEPPPACPVLGCRPCSQWRTAR